MDVNAEHGFQTNGHKVKTITPTAQIITLCDSQEPAEHFAEYVHET